MSTKVNVQDLLAEADNDELDDDELLDLSEEDIKNSLPQQPSTKLAELVISFRYLGLYKDLSMLAMEELAKRRMGGDNFQYEKYIEDNLKTLPKLEFKMPNLDSILKSYGKR